MFYSFLQIIMPKRSCPWRESIPVQMKMHVTQKEVNEGVARDVNMKAVYDGFVFVDDLLSLPRFRCHSIEDLQRVVETNDKQRYAMCPHPDSGRLQIRANQGHSIPVEDLELTPIHTSSEDVPVTAVHGTYLRNWNAIRSHGLSRMNRTHIHLAPGLPGQGQVVSGMRKDCDLAIFVDLQQALRDGIPFFWSANRVILTPGNSEGLIPPLYFSRALQLKHPKLPYQIMEEDEKI
ncbi:TRPT1 phosphotransferase, partial [Polypterus senegalus]